jgi:hypothetical protein
MGTDSFREWYIDRNSSNQELGIYPRSELRSGGEKDRSQESGDRINLVLRAFISEKQIPHPAGRGFGMTGLGWGALLVRASSLLSELSAQGHSE